MKGKCDECCPQIILTSWEHFCWERLFKMHKGRSVTCSFSLTKNMSTSWTLLDASYLRRACALISSPFASPFTLWSYRRLHVTTPGKYLSHWSFPLIIQHLRLVGRSIRRDYLTNLSASTVHDGPFFGGRRTPRSSRAPTTRR